MLSSRFQATDYLALVILVSYAMDKIFPRTTPCPSRAKGANYAENDGPLELPLRPAAEKHNKTLYKSR